ncbi:DNA ligase 1 isoform X2 [Periplaneta americana]
MRERFNAVDTVGRTTLNQATPLITCKSNKPMERAKNGARYFRNPPQPHMCIQDFIQGYKEPCYINVLSWIKISTPRRPEDPIPLYGGMRIPYNSTAALAVPNDRKNLPKKQPIIFAVMANPEILRLSGKTAKDPMDRDALVDLMLDFVEAMNPEVKFKREFSVLKDRDLTGELKDIWLAIQVKREREKEKAENGKKMETGDREKRKDLKDEETWREVEKQRDTKAGEEKEKCSETLAMWFAMERAQSRERGREEMEPKDATLAHSEIHSKADQQNGKKYNLEEEMIVSRIPIASFSTDFRKLGEVSVRQTKNSVLATCDGSVIPSREAKNSPTHQRKSKIRSCKGELFTQTIQQFDEVKDRKEGDIHVNEICTITKHTVFKEIFPSSSDSSEDEERGDFHFDSGDPKQRVDVLGDAKILSISRNLDDGDTGLHIDDSLRIEKESGSNIARKAAPMEEACSYENADSHTSIVKPYKFLRMKSSAIKKAAEKQVSGKQNVHVGNKFKTPEQADYESADSCQNKARYPDFNC